jgi:hypothetical protein
VDTLVADIESLKLRQGRPASLLLNRAADGFVIFLSHDDYGAVARRANKGAVKGVADTPDLLPAGCEVKARR